MAAKNTALPFRPAFDGNALPIAGAKMVLTLSGTTTLVSVWSNVGMSVAATNPIIANAAGRFPQRWVNDNVALRMRIFDADADITVATPIEDFDPYTPVETGSAGATGSTGASTATITLGTTSTGAAGTSTILTNTGTATAAILNFTVPRGNVGASGALSDGTFSGIVVSGTGTALDVATGHITLARMANMATASLLGRNTAGTGVPEVLSAATTKTLLSLNNVDNTTDALKPVSTAGAAADALKAPLTPREQAVASSATVTPTFLNDIVIITAQAAGLTLANPSGTAVPNHGFVVRIKDNGTARAITYGSQYRGVGATLPTTTVLSKTMYLGVIYNATDTTCDVVSVLQQA